MKLLVEINERKWQSVQDGTWCGSQEIAMGQPLPDDCEILTKEAYEDLCKRAAEGSMSEQERWLRGL